MKIEKIIAQLGALPRAVRIGTIAGFSAIVLISIVAMLVAHSPRTALFASALHAEQLAEIEERLAEWNVPFTPTADNVIVDASRRNDLLLRLSLAGVPHSHVETTGEALANVGVLTPQAVIDAQARSGLAGDIEVALRSVNGVDDAHVIIAPAKIAEFADEGSRDASASIRLQLHPGVQLSRAAVAGIRQFVAASVEGLDPAHVTILDDRGLALGDIAGNFDDADALQRSLQSALDAALGAGAAIVRVHVDYNRAVTQRHDIVRMPVSAVPIERNIDSESYAGGDKRYQKSDEHDEHGSDTREISSRADAGAVARITTAVFVDSSRALDLAKVHDLAAATVGFDARRGDVLAVQAVDFHHALQQKHDGWFLLYGAIVPLLPTLALVVGLLILAKLGSPAFVSIVKSATERASIARVSQSVAGYAPAQVRGALAHEPPHAAAAIISALPAATAAAVLELYPPHEREAIVRRMQRPHTPIIPHAEEILGYHA